MNTCTLLGNLTKDIEKKTGKNGAEFYVFTVADNQGKEKDQVIFWDVIMFNQLNSNFLSYLKKGSAVIVTGQVNPVRTYAKKDGTTGTSMSFTAISLNFSPFKTAKSEGSAPQAEQQQAAAPAAPQQNNENLPF